MKSQLVFEQESELQRLRVQNALLSPYEAPVLAQLFSGGRSLSVLDVGCNDGSKTVERFAAEAVFRVIGLEYNPALAQSAEEKYGSDKFSFFALDVESPAFGKALGDILKEKGIEGFDLIYLSFLLMHLGDPKRFLTALRPFLKPEGRLFILEPDDSASALSGDAKGLFGEFLEILGKDPYAGRRDLGRQLCEMLPACGYEAPFLWQGAISAGEGEAEKKRAIYTTFFSYLGQDLHLLLEASPENPEYRAWAAWLEKNQETLRRLILKDGSAVSMGMKILTCAKGRP